jgi:hypothetical protein
METIKKILDYIAPNGAYISALVEYHIGCGECEVAYANTQPTKHWEHYGEDLITLPDSIPNYVEQLFTLSEQMLHAGVDNWATEVRVIANSLAEALQLN